jgi:hypothetical protein
MMATSGKMAALREVAPYSLVGIDRRFRGTLFLHYQGGDCPDNGGRKVL